MHRQPHRALEKTVDNRYWQNQFRTDDAEFGPPKELEAYEPPTLTAASLPAPRQAQPFDEWRVPADRPSKKR